jgi:fructose-bisphosphate aldolase, class II
LRQTLQQAESDAVAIGHFNISDLVGLKSAFDSARELNVPVIVGTSEGEREFMGVHQAATVVKSLCEQYEFPIFLNADHTHSLKAAIEAAKAGYDWVVFDVSSQPLEQNIRQTKETVEALKSIWPDTATKCPFFRSSSL